MLQLLWATHEEDCQSRYTCRYCNRAHHTLLHVDREQQYNSTQQNVNINASQNNSARASRQPPSKTSPHTNPTSLLIDQQTSEHSVPSGVSPIPTPPHNTLVGTLHDRKKVNSSSKVLLVDVHFQQT